MSTIGEVLDNCVTAADESRTFRVFKVGRTTGLTAGTFNEIRSDCQRGDKGPTREWCIIDLYSIGRFARKGDCGSPVFDYQGRLVGILNGVLSDSVGSGVTYMTPIEWVFENIEKTIGNKVTLG